MALKWRENEMKTVTHVYAHFVTHVFAPCHEGTCSILCKVRMYGPVTCCQLLSVYPSSPSAPLPCQPAPHPFLHLRSQPGPIVGIAALTNALGLRRVGVNDSGQSAQTEASRHRHADFTDHFAGVTSNNGCPEDFIPTFSDMQFHKTIFLTVQNRAVYLLKLAHV